jgi:glycosyltransferase involved in cell wall biosynthesis
LKRPLLLVEALASHNDSGLGNMTRLFVDGLRGLAGFADIKVISPRSAAYRPGPHCESILVSPKPVRVWSQAVFPLLIRRLKPDAVFCLGQNLPGFRPAARYALAIPDAGPLEDLGLATSSHDPYNRRWLRSMAPRADAIVTISQFTKNRLATLLDIPQERIRVVLPIRPPGLPDSISGQNPSGVARSSAPTAPGAHPPGEYFLALGNVEPRKNYPGLIAAYAALKARRPGAPPLYIVGHKAWGASEAEAAVEKSGLTGRVHFTGYLSDADRLAHLAHCSAYVSSSLYEGWGLPLFEALSHGKPAVYHAGSSQEEFARGVALAVDCRDPQALSRAMETLWSDVGERGRLGRAMAAEFPRIRAYDLETALSDALRPLLEGPRRNP